MPPLDPLLKYRWRENPGSQIDLTEPDSQSYFERQLRGHCFPRRFEYSNHWRLPSDRGFRFGLGFGDPESIIGSARFARVRPFFEQFGDDQVKATCMTLLQNQIAFNIQLK